MVNWEHWHFSLSWQSSVQSQHDRKPGSRFNLTPSRGVRAVLYSIYSGLLRSIELIHEIFTCSLPPVISKLLEYASVVQRSIEECQLTVQTTVNDFRLEFGEAMDTVIEWEEIDAQLATSKTQVAMHFVSILETCAKLIYNGSRSRWTCVSKITETLS